MPSINTKILWAAEDTQAVAKTQTLVDDGFMVLNGNLARPVNVFSFNTYGWSRTVSVTTSDDLTGIKFYVRGYSNGLYTEDTIADVNNTTAYGTIPFDTIIEIQLTNPIPPGSTASVGTGNKGFFAIQNLNISEQVLSSIVIQTVLNQVGTTFKYSLYFTADDTLPYNTQSLASLIAKGAYIALQDPSYTNRTTSSLFFGLPVLASSFVIEVVEVTDPTSTAKLIFMQL